MFVSVLMSLMKTEELEFTGCVRQHEENSQGAVEA
jgi:hypothetical protein